MQILPDVIWPPPTDHPIWLALMLIVATLAAEALARGLRFPRLAGYALTGVAFAALGLDVGDAPTGAVVQVVIDLALAIVLFETGTRVSLRWLRTNPWLVLQSVVEAALSGALVVVALRLLGVAMASAVACGVVAVAASPAVFLRVATESRASGPVTERVLLLGALNTAYAVIAAKFLMGWQWHLQTGEAWSAIGQVGYLLGGSVLVAVVFGGFVGVAVRRMDPLHDNTVLLVLALIGVAALLARQLALSTLLVPLLAGVALRRMSERPWVWHRNFGTAASPLVVLMFVLVASAAPMASIAAGIVPALALIGARFAGKMIGCMALALPSASTFRQGALAGLAMLPLSGTALVLTREILEVGGLAVGQIAPILLTAIVLLEVLGPVLALAALRRARETADEPA